MPAIDRKDCSINSIISWLTFGSQRTTSEGDPCRQIDSILSHCQQIKEKASKEKPN